MMCARSTRSTCSGPGKAACSRSLDRPSRDAQRLPHPQTPVPVGVALHRSATYQGSLRGMSAALNGRADTSVQSAGTVPDLSLSSLTSAFSTPGRALRVPSASSHTTATSSAPISTPSPPNVPSLSRKRGDEATPAAKRLGLSSHDEEGEDVEGDVLDTPGREKKWEDTAATPGRMKRTRSAGAKGGVNLTLRDQEKVCVAGLYSPLRATPLAIAALCVL